LRREQQETQLRIAERMTVQLCSQFEGSIWKSLNGVKIEAVRCINGSFWIKMNDNTEEYIPSIDYAKE
jgi:hypothetical protein